MRILHVIQRYWPAVGGAEIHLGVISERLAAEGHQVTVATTDALNLVAANSRLTVWDLPQSTNTRADWPMFRRNATRTGVVGQPTVPPSSRVKPTCRSSKGSSRGGHRSVRGWRKSLPFLP